MTLFAKVYVDEDVDVLVATLLLVRGIDAIATRDRGMLGKSDPEQLVYATSVERCILTHNRVYFERLHLEYIDDEREHSGIIIVPPKSAYEIVKRVSILLNYLTADEIANQLLYV